MDIRLTTGLLLTFLLAVFAVCCECKKFRPEQLYRIVDRNLGCESGSLITTFEGYSLSTCASACKVDPKCGMFAVENGKMVKRNDSVFIPRGPMRQKCELCKSTNMTSTVLREGWTTYMEWLKDARFPIMETDNHTSSASLEADEMWNIDCNRPDITDYRNGVIVAIWDDKDGFRDLDKVKCMNWGEMDIISGEKPSRLLHIHLEDYRRCPKNYVLTAITASNAAFRNVDKGKCSPLIPELHVDYDHCVTVNSEGQDGGPSDKWRPWRVQCPPSGPHVAVSLNRRRRIHTGLQCCLLKGLDE